MHFFKPELSHPSFALPHGGHSSSWMIQMLFSMTRLQTIQKHHPSSRVLHWIDCGFFCFGNFIAVQLLLMPNSDFFTSSQGLFPDTHTNKLPTSKSLSQSLFLREQDQRLWIFPKPEKNKWKNVCKILWKNSESWLFALYVSMHAFSFISF